MSQSQYKRGSAIALSAFAALLVTRNARAQLDTNPPLQNVMLLVDSSGSMEFADDGSVVQCDETDTSLSSTIAPKGPSQKSRWTQLIEVLTGDINNPQCYTQDRSSTDFRTEYALNTVDPYDFNYHVPYHRILSVTGGFKCTVGAGVLDSDPFAWGSTPFRYHPWNAKNDFTDCTGLSQAETGLLDSYRDRLRFGLMTFDTSVDAGTGVTAGGSPDYLGGSNGTWSYFLNWRTNPDCNGNSACAKGRPAGCSTPPAPLEVGARNAAAPPWEGRMVPFGSPAATITDVRATNDNIQRVLTAVRPFGATPINGLLNDARDFFVNDDDPDYTTGSTSCDHDTGVGCFGPKYDGLVAHKCRKNNIILLTDGEPNLDLRPFCEGTSGGLDGVCPYTDKSFEIVQKLADPLGANIQTFVVGFAVSTVTTGGSPTPVDCSKISSVAANGGSGTFDPNNVCGPAMDPSLSACCTLAKIAFYGNTGNAYFATNATELRNAISQILDRIGGTVSTRTAPVFAANANSTYGGAFSFFSSFRSGEVTSVGQTLRSGVWSGVLERQRTECIKDTTGGVTTISAKAQTVDPQQGDDFSANVNSNDTSHPRALYTVIGDADGSGARLSKRSIRPSLSTDDGIGIYSGAAFHGGVTDFVPTNVPATALNVKATDPTCASYTPVPSTDDECAAIYLKWELGANPSPYIYTRDNVFGAIYHSTPSLVGVPNEFLRDESYTQFTVDQALRPPVLYVSTTDGQLHAFKADKAAADAADTKVDRIQNNELWSFFPPAVLPKIPAQYPGTQQILLDGSPVIKDVVYTRSDTDAKSGGGSVAWHTVLVSSFGAGGPGYFALDITNPVPKSGVANSGPKMLWQLTTDSSDQPLFGQAGGTPVITTLFYGPGGTDPKEYAVAILPGGVGAKTYATAPCDTPPTTDNLVDSSYPARAKVRCPDQDPARSLTIVNLETGEIIRSFRRQVDGPASILARSHDDTNKYTPLIAAISGQPVVFPAGTGEVADRAYVGDSEGLLWRVDLSSPDPQKWSMALFFDAFSGDGPNGGQPIATPPILSVDTIGNVTVAFSTGDQESFAQQTGMKNHLWSLLEDTSSAFKSIAQWDLLLNDGDRVSGQMQLFNSNLYYAVYTPPPINPSPSQQCSSGNSQICAVHYLRPAASAHAGGEVAKPPIDPTQPTLPCMSQGDAVIFGPGITQEPTCSASDTYNDPYLGAGQHTSLANVTAGKFDLVVQTGANGKNETKGQINTTTIGLQSPMAGTRIDSWAAVVE
jgi:type IV pilus assembly protein PilY1